MPVNMISPRSVYYRKPIGRNVLEKNADGDHLYYNNNEFTTENGDLFYACITNNSNITQQNQILQIIPQNQMSNLILSNKSCQTINNEDQSLNFEKNQFINFSNSINKSSETITKPNCFICKIDFPSKRTYSKHMTIHENDREFKCDSCKMSYNYYVNLLVHIAIIHPDECSLKRAESDNENFRCLVCSLKFNRSKALQGHCLIHQIDEELTCDHCSLTFSSRPFLNKHINETCGRNNQKITFGGMCCKICQEIFSNVGQMKQHYKLSHPKDELLNEVQNINLKKPKEIDIDQNFDPKNRRKSSKKASETIKLYAQGKIKDTTENINYERRQRGRPKKHFNSSNTESKNNVICNTCNRIFKTPILLRRHEVTHTGAKDFECHICHKKFTQKSSVKIHMVVHENDKAFKCPICFKTFTYEHNMNTHFRTVHRTPDKPAIDETVKGNLKKNHKHSYDSNIKVFNEDYTFVPYNSDAYYNSAESNLIIIKDENIQSNNIIQSDGNEVPQYYWQEAIPISMSNGNNQNVYVPSTENFIKHDWDKSQTINTNNCGILLSEEIDKIDKETGCVQVQEVIKDQITGFKRFRCKFCKKLYRKSCDLSRHVRIHYQQRPFKCYLCYKTFRLKSVLKRHFKSHWKLKEFACQICDKSFNLKQTLKVHSRLHNADEMKYSCNICYKKFNTSFHCQYHIKAQHDKEMGNAYFLETDETANIKSVILDGKQFVQSTPPVQPNRPHKCSYCPKSYKLKRYLRDHLKEHLNNSRRNCSYCSKTFRTLRSLQQHLRSLHLNRNIFLCSKCPAKFILKASLLRHGLVHSTLKPYACPICFRQFKAKLYCDRHINLRKCSKKSNSPNNQLRPLTVANEINSTEVNFESEIITAEQASLPYCNLRLIDLDMNTANSSNILVTNYVDDFNNYSNTDKFMVVSLDNGKVGNHQNEIINNNYYTSNILMDDGAQGENCRDMLENQMNVAPVEIGAIYNYDNNNFNNHQQSQNENIYYYQTVTKNDEQQSSSKGTLADKFPILKATLFADDDIKSPKPMTSDFCSPENQTQITPKRINETITNFDRNSLNKNHHGCANCNLEFNDSSSLLKHVKLNHKLSKDFLCHVCHKSFSVNLSLWAHSKIHEPSYSEGRHSDFFACIACDLKFISVPSLSRHVRMQHNDKLNLYRCIHCDKRYKTTRELDSHIKQLNSDFDAILINSHLINTSDNSIDKGNLKVTREIKDPNFCKDFLIELQDSEIDHIASLDVSKTLKLSMQELIKAAKEKRGLNKSTRLSKSSSLENTITYPYSCSVCHKGFSRASNLQQHLAVHTKVTPYQCLKCNQRFRHRCSLKTHENTKHSVMMKLLRCHLCTKLLRSQVALRNHMKIHLKSYSFRCEKCLRHFTTLEDKNAHFTLKQCSALSPISDKSKIVELDEADLTVTKAKEIFIKLVKCVKCSIAYKSIHEYENHCCIKQKRKVKLIKSLSPPPEKTKFVDLDSVDTPTEKEDEDKCTRLIKCVKCSMAFKSTYEYEKHICIKRKRKIKQYLALSPVSDKIKVPQINVAEPSKNKEEEICITLVKCVKCSIAFKSIHEYENHSCIRQKHKLYQCILCDLSYNSSSQLNLHVSEVHKQHKKYNCSVCNLVFLKEILLLNHQKSVHNL